MRITEYDGKPIPVDMHLSLSPRWNVMFGDCEVTLTRTWDSTFLRISYEHFFHVIEWLARRESMQPVSRMLDIDDWMQVIYHQNWQLYDRRGRPSHARPHMEIWQGRKYRYGFAMSRHMFDRVIGYVRRAAGQMGMPDTT